MEVGFYADCEPLNCVQNCMCMFIPLSFLLSTGMSPQSSFSLGSSRRTSGRLQMLSPSAVGQPKALIPLSQVLHKYYRFLSVLHHEGIQEAWLDHSALWPNKY